MLPLARLAAPALAALALRLSQLMILLVLARLSGVDDRAALLASFGVIGALAVMTDSGAANFLLSTGRAGISRAEVRTTLLIHTSLSLVGGFAAVLFSAIVFETAPNPDQLLLVIALAATQVVDSIVRVARTPLLVIGADHRFASFDVALALGKMTVVGACFLASNVSFLMCLPAISAAALVVALRHAFVAATDSLPSGEIVSRIMLFGCSGVASSLYSQSPLLIAGLFQGETQVALLTICYRALQPLELVPATLSQQVVPRAAAGTLRLGVTWSAFAALGLFFAVTVVLVTPAIETLLAVTDIAVVLALLAASVPFKFGNYALSAFLFATGRVAQKLRATLAVGLVTIVLATLAAQVGDIRWIAGVTFLAELLLLLALARAQYDQPIHGSIR